VSASSRVREPAPAAPPALKLPRVEVRILSHQLVTALREAILSGDLPPGQRLIEAEIAQQMGVSRAPVREAIRHLDQEGLVEIFPHRGAVVVGVGDQEIEAVYKVRAAIEAEAFERACSRITSEQCAGLRTLVDEMGSHARRRQTAELIEKDLAFHRTVLEISGYTVLRRVWDSLDGIMRIRTLQAVARPTKAAQTFLEATVAAHLELVEALEAREPARAGLLAHEHIVGVARQLKAS
jgi:DNA-binding GntR family transcriptional regulator